MARSPSMHRKPWTKAEIRDLRRLSKQKAGLEKIAKHLKRTAWSVRNRAYAERISLSTR